MCSRNVKYLAITMESGEPQLERCTEALLAQQGVDVEHVLVSGLPNVEAHLRCYREIEARSDEFDVAIKLDADMVLAGADVLGRLGRWFTADRDLDHAQVAIHDFFTDRPIMGLQVFSPRVRWPGVSDGLFVDPAPIIPGRRCEVWEPPALVAHHAPDPSRQQAFQFGIHRAQKAFQRDRHRIRGSQARDQWRTLLATWDAFLGSHDLRRGLAVFAADLVWRGTIDHRFDYRRSCAGDLLAGAPSSAAEMRNLLSPRWEHGMTRGLRHAAALGLAGTSRFIAAAVVDRRRKGAVASSRWPAGET